MPKPQKKVPLRCKRWGGEGVKCLPFRKKYKFLGRFFIICRKNSDCHKAQGGVKGRVIKEKRTFFPTFQRPLRSSGWGLGLSGQAIKIRTFF